MACAKDNPTTFGTGGRDAEMVAVVTRGGADDVVEVECDAVETNALVVEVVDPAGVALGFVVLGVGDGVALRFGADEAGRGCGLGVAGPGGAVAGEVEETSGCAWVT
ncbi:MAG TPA: hypothetical protein VHO26_02295 [Propionibacteriaceae bacterium]|nr:hypothetical protein [Propionibacteriaceae bacterium]